MDGWIDIEDGEEKKTEQNVRKAKTKDMASHK